MVFPGGAPLHTGHTAHTVNADITLPKHTVAVVCNETAAAIELEDQYGVAVIYAAAAVTAMGHVIPGQWRRIINAGTGATNVVSWQFNAVSRA